MELDSSSVPDFRQALANTEFRPFLKKSNGLALRSLGITYGLIALAFALPILFPHAVTVLLGIVLLGNRQLGLGILMHDCVHGALFTSSNLNRWVGEYVCAAPIFAQFEGYRRYHLRHHAKAGTKDDPDYPNYQPYPVSKRSLMRKFLRDLAGITGLKNLYILMLMHAGYIEYDMSYQTHSRQRKLGVFEVGKQLFRNMLPALGFHALLIAILWFCNAVVFYAMWWAAYLTTFMLFSRIRNAAEHANVPDLLSADPRLHARTVYASWWEKLTVAPCDVNYHLEHHWMPAIPPYRLKGFHQHLLKHNLLDQTAILSGYRDVISALVR
ncbi:fatty acid desaturase family protein [Aestuariibacter sp. AA17]|uniref:Fatty acid desaturase family protein n=1 Tax=Fluctibacter corallii TaxID=2984329 RepID=A0ABT3A965_9ALTE|nr:fatty acid desaturase family protein [Aestuariibacter sp. AA17]MCV2885220.1 fatty acid desaturase family protein [Aestuariibacter sp. AA17]